MDMIKTHLFLEHFVMKKANDPFVNIRGVSENFQSGRRGKVYEPDKSSFNSVYYRVKVGHTARDNFNPIISNRWQILPTEGGANATFANSFDTVQFDVPHGTVYTEVQDVVDFILGYPVSKQTGFLFETYNQILQEIEDWKLSAQEYMFRTTQNWDSGAVLTLSPSARQIAFSNPYAVVDDIYNNFYDYSLLKADGKRLLADFATQNETIPNDFGIYVKNTQEGIYHLKIPQSQTEHAIAP